MIEIYHMADDWPGEVRFAASYGTTADADALALFAQGRYVHVASVESDNLELAWRLTNNVDGSWSMQADPRVSVRAPFPKRRDGTYMGHKSSEVGDIAVRDGSIYRVAMIGWQKIGEVRDAQSR